MANGPRNPADCGDNQATRLSKRREAKREASRPTVATLAKTYLREIEDHKGAHYKKSHREIGRYFWRCISPRFGTLVAEALEYDNTRHLLDEIRSAHGDRTANLSHAYLSGLLSWSTRRPATDPLRIRFNPMRDIPRVGRSKKPHETRTRDLRLSELAIFWHGFDATFQPRYKIGSKRRAGAKTGNPQRVMRRDDTGTPAVSKEKRIQSFERHTVQSTKGCGYLKWRSSPGISSKKDRLSELYTMVKLRFGIDSTTTPAAFVSRSRSDRPITVLPNRRLCRF